MARAPAGRILRSSWYTIAAMLWKLIAAILWLIAKDPADAVPIVVENLCSICNQFYTGPFAFCGYCGQSRVTIMVTAAEANRHFCTGELCSQNQREHSLYRRPRVDTQTGDQNQCLRSHENTWFLQATGMNPWSTGQSTA